MEAKGAAPPPPNPNPNRPPFLAAAAAAAVSVSGPPPSKPMLAFYFLQALSRIRGVTPLTRRTRTIRRAAYNSMARAANPRRAWSRALLRQARTRRSITSRRAAVLVRRRVVGGVAPATAARSSGTAAGETSSAAAAARALAPRRQAGEPPRTDALRRLVPGGAGMEYCSLLEETADYVRCLRAQVQLMQGLADLFSSCQ